MSVANRPSDRPAVWLLSLTLSSLLAACDRSPAGSTAPATPEVKSTSPAAEDTTPAAASGTRGTAPDPILGTPLVINGQQVPFEEVQAQVCLGGKGMAEIELQKLRIFMDEEMQRRLKEGASASDLEVSEQEMGDFLEELEDQIKAEYPEGGVGMDEVLASAGGDPKERVRLTKLFHKLFLPENTDLWPPITLEAAATMDGGQQIIDYYKETWERRKAEPNPPKRTVAERSFDSAIVSQIVAYLNETARIERRPAPGVLYRINGVDIRQADIWQKIRADLSDLEVRAAKQWIANMTLLREALQKAGAWLTDEEAEAAYRAESDPYKKSIFSIESMAVVLKRFPSVDAYKEHQHVYESFRRMKAPEMTEEALQKQADFRTSKVVGQVTVDVDVILTSAFDFKTQRWKPDGWTQAEQRMQEVLRLLTDEGRPWDEVVDQYSEIYEAPVPASQKAQQDPNAPKKGRFRGLQRNNLLGQLGESDYWHFLNGNSITDFIFFQQEVGTLGDPLKGPWGYYLPRLLRRTSPPQRLPVDPDTYKVLIEEDYLLWHLNEFTQKLIRENEVYGLE